MEFRLQHVDTCTFYIELYTCQAVIWQCLVVPRMSNFSTRFQSISWRCLTHFRATIRHWWLFVVQIIEVSNNSEWEPLWGFCVIDRSVRLSDVRLTGFYCTSLWRCLYVCLNLCKPFPMKYGLSALACEQLAFILLLHFELAFVMTQSVEVRSIILSSYFSEEGFSMAYLPI